MAELINHNSAILFSLVVLIIGAVLMVRRGLETKRIVAFGVLVVLVTAAFFSMRPEAGTTASASDINTVIGSGIPVLLEFQSRN